MASCTTCQSMPCEKKRLNKLHFMRSKKSIVQREMPHSEYKMMSPKVKPLRGVSSSSLEVSAYGSHSLPLSSSLSSTSISGLSIMRRCNAERPICAILVRVILVRTILPSSLPSDTTDGGGVL